jgi:hypothetical protein
MMANLFWRRSTRPVLNLLSVSFKTTDECEQAVFKIEPGVTRVETLLPLLNASVQDITRAK